MSQHANQAVKGGPSAQDEEIRGNNPTYKSHVQKESRSQSSTKPVGSGSDTEKVIGEGSAPVDPTAEERAEVFGSGHYTPSRG